ncbi:MAG: hemerythrin domain-containing protein [Dehalococcoidia bacterium]|jgi:hemerythrin-like domain-containing protein
MKPIGPLMVEHRLIERMIALLKEEAVQARKSNTIDVEFLQTAVDFIRSYADRTHHGKEEDILFRDLALKQLAPDHKRIMEELIEEHMSARKMVAALVEARQGYMRGNSAALKDVIDLLEKLADFYPGHIEKEDKHFFYPIQDYFSKEEQDKMLLEFWEFDRKLIHEKYRKVVESLEHKPDQSSGSQS